MTPVCFVRGASAWGFWANWVCPTSGGIVWESFQKRHTLPETISKSTWNTGVWKTSFLLRDRLFSGAFAVSFREGKCGFELQEYYILRCMSPSPTFPSEKFLGGGNSNICLCSPRSLGFHDPTRRADFSNGLVQPPTRKLHVMFESHLSRLKKRRLKHRLKLWNPFGEDNSEDGPPT